MKNYTNFLIAFGLVVTGSLTAMANPLPLSVVLTDCESAPAYATKDGHQYDKPAAAIADTCIGKKGTPVTHIEFSPSRENMLVLTTRENSLTFYVLSKMTAQEIKQMIEKGFAVQLSRAYAQIENPTYESDLADYFKNAKISDERHDDDLSYYNAHPSPDRLTSTRSDVLFMTYFDGSQKLQTLQIGTIQ